MYPLTLTPCTSFIAAHDARLTLTAPLHGSDNRQSLAAHLNHYLILILNALLFFMSARQSAGQINKIKWQTHYKASGSQAVRQASGGKWQESGMDAPSGNVTATSRQRDRRAATMQRWLHRTHCTKKWPTMRAVQKAQWWLNTRLAAVVTPLPSLACLFLLSVGCSSYLLPVAAALFACSGQMPAAMAALPPLGH